jgi:tRNA 2-thiouridine synthesizing protein E
MYGLVHPGSDPAREEPKYPDAPEDWSEDQAASLAAKAGLKLTEDHWEAIRVLQGCYKDEASPRIRLLHHALEARFAAKGGKKYLYDLFPGGPIAQGCALAGVKPPSGARDPSFGSVA